jgi:archaellum component FlaD/FlaE
MEVRFSAGSGTAVDMQTFRATYGWLGINITRRLLEHAKKTTDTLLAEDVDLPFGDHKVTLSIANISGKTASRTFRFSVAR